MVAEVSQDGGDHFQRWGSKGGLCSDVGQPVQRCNTEVGCAVVSGCLQALSNVSRGRLPHRWGYHDGCSVPDGGDGMGRAPHW